VVTLVLSAGVAAYAALSTDAARETQGGDPNGQPLQAQVPEAPGPGAQTNTPPATDPAVPAPLPEGGAEVPIPSGGGGGATSDPLTPSSGGGGASPAPSSGGGGLSGGSSGGSGGGAPAGGPVGAIALAPGAGEVQFPDADLGREGARFGDVTKAYDDSEARVWTASVPADGQPFGLGLAFSLEQLRDVRSVTLDLDGREGFSVDVYGSTSSTKPPDMLDGRWGDPIGSDANVQDGDSISLDADGRVRHILVRITKAPKLSGDNADRRGVSIAEVRLRGR